MHPAVHCGNTNCGKTLRVVGDVPFPAPVDSISSSSGRDTLEGAGQAESVGLSQALSEWSSRCGVNVALCDGCLLELVTAQEQLRMQFYIYSGVAGASMVDGTSHCLRL